MPRWEWPCSTPRSDGRAESRWRQRAGCGRSLAAAPGSTLLFPRRQALAHLAGSLVDAGLPLEALQVAREAVATPAEDVRSRVLALRALGTALHATGDDTRAEQAYQQALDIAVATQARSEEAQTRKLLAFLKESASSAS